jgi:mannosyltransferase OCH1-like enzyme
MADVIQALWIGDRLSSMEQLCIASFLQNGHPVHLYVYQETAGIPAGTTVLDGNSVLPASRIFTYREHKTYAGFANFFRYKLLLEKGGWFVDSDTICVRPFDFSDEYVFSSEGINARQLPNVGAMKVPPGSAIMQYAWNACNQFEPSDLKWSQCGPTLLAKALEEYSMQMFVQPWDVFCPIHFSLWEQMLDAGMQWAFPEHTHAIHLWNELWRREGRDKDAPYPRGCLYEDLKKRYLA